MRRIEAPVTKASGYHHDTVTTHPAFAQIAVSRTSGGHSTLYGSDFDHHSRMTIRIHASELHRGLSNDHYFERGQYVEIDLSEAQWATFVSSPNMGSGTPCTLRRFKGETIAELPAPETRTKQFGREMKDSIDRAMSDLDAAVAFVDTLGLSKKKADELKSKIAIGGRRLRDVVPFVADQFDEHMEGTIEKAKVEVHGYMTGQIARAGLLALGGDPDAVVPLSLPGAD